MGNPDKSFLLIAVAVIAIGTAAITGYTFGQDSQAGLSHGLNELAHGIRALGESRASGPGPGSFNLQDRAAADAGRYALHQADPTSPLFLLDTSTGTVRVLDHSTGEWLWTSTNTKRIYGTERPSGD